MNPASKLAPGVQWALAVLLVAAPLAEGGARPWALTFIEVLGFATLALSLAAVAGGARSAPPPHALRSLLVPAGLFGAMVLLQLAPLPPAVLRTVSPAAWRLYAVSLPGWPRANAPADGGDWAPPRNATAAARAVDPARWRMLPTADEIARGAPMPFAGQGASGAPAPAPRQSASGAAAAWRTLSLAPAMTAGVLFEFAAYAALLFALLVLPLGPPGGRGEQRLYRALIGGVLVSGLGVAVIGIVEFFTWNGRILWIFVPYDWGAPQPGAALRASGPFVNPDHFGNYLAMVLPLAVAGTLFPSGLFGRARALRVLSAASAFLITCALLLSLSRGAWAGATLGLAVLCALAGPAPQPGCAQPARQAHQRLLKPLCAAVFALVAFALLFIGPGGRELVDARLEQTVHVDGGISGRLQLGASTLAMARDYPLAGVGLGAWAETFARYRRPPWEQATFREAHNDYAQLLAETGALGFALAAWFFAAAAVRGVRALRAAPAAMRPALAALYAGLSATALHELLDFSLHTPANALLFVAMLALALRPAVHRAAAPGAGAAPAYAVRRAAALAGALGAAALAALALWQDNIPYPEDIRPPATLAQARAFVAAHPAQSAAHLALVRLAGARLGPRARMAELQAAAWLDPANPWARDALAGAQLAQGETAQALASITRSVADSPLRATHFYLAPRLVPWLTPDQRRAVEAGFRRALDRHYSGAVEGLASFEDALGRYAAEGAVYERAAGVARDRDLRARYLLGAGAAYARTGDFQTARGLLERAIGLVPAATAVYESLIATVLGPRRELVAAEAAVARGVRAGADAAALYAALAHAAEAANDRALAQGALAAAAAARPSFAALLELGKFYLDAGRYQRAALVMRRAAAREPYSAEARFYLGLAEERDYRFSAAERDLAQAARLAPKNPEYREHYADFERRLAQSMRLELRGFAPPAE